jgi:hypothetical protein
MFLFCFVFRIFFALYWKVYIDAPTKLPRGERFNVYYSSSDIFRLWAELFDRADSSVSEMPGQSTLSVPTIFRLLHEVAEYRKLLLKVLPSHILFTPPERLFTQFLPDLPISHSRITISITEDDVEIAVVLQRLVQVKSYKHEIPTVSEEAAFSVLNLTHHASSFSRTISTYILMFLRSSTVACRRTRR